jgi:L-alanine-DL-glutamate epimerase-like enolase superfamily enzyme
VDVVNFDASWGGGPTEWLRVANMAQIFNIDMGHHEEFQVAAHLLASVPNSRFVEIFEEERDPIFWNLIENRPSIEDGKIQLPNENGFGWVLDRDYIKKYTN